MYPSDLRGRLRAMLYPAPAPEVPDGSRAAAVLLPLIDGPEPRVVFTRRTEGLPRHPGEISFPGGLRDPQDAGLREAALRETAEELGIPERDVEVLGALTPVHTHVSAILIVPFVGMMEEAPTFAPSPGEIAEVLQYPMANLAEAEATVEWPIGDHVYRGFAYDMGGNTIWGATAVILHEFLEVARRPLP